MIKHPLPAIRCIQAEADYNAISALLLWAVSPIGQSLLLLPVFHSFYAPARSSRAPSSPPSPHREASLMSNKLSIMGTSLAQQTRNNFHPRFSSMHSGFLLVTIIYIHAFQQFVILLTHFS